MNAPSGAPSTPVRETTLRIEGMTCASCSGRVEKALLKVPGVVSAAVNLATEHATVQASSDVPTSTLQAAVEKAGYAASALPDPAQRAVAESPTPWWPVAASVGADAADRGADGAVAVRRPRDARWLAAAGAGDSGPVLARCALLPGGLACAPGRQRQHGSAGRDRHQCRVRPFGLPAVRAGPRRRAASVFRGLGGGDLARPARQVARRAREAADRRGDPRAPCPAAGDGTRSSRGRRGRRAGRARDGRRSRRRPSRRADPGRRHRQRRPQRRRRIVAHRRGAADREGARRSGHRRLDQCRRCARRRDESHRHRDDAGAHHPHGRVGAGGEGADPAHRRPRQRGLRAGGARHRGADGGRLARCRRRLGAGDRQRGRRAGDRVPVRARPRDPDGDHRRHRRRGGARHSHQGRRGARGRAVGRYRGLRQDRDAHRRSPGRRRRRRGSRRARRCGAPANSRVATPEHASAGACGVRARPASAGSTSRRWQGPARSPAAASKGRSLADAMLSAARGCSRNSASTGSRSPRRPRPSKRRAARSRGSCEHDAAGARLLRPAGVRRHRQAACPRRGGPAARTPACGPCC